MPNFSVLAPAFLAHDFSDEEKNDDEDQNGEDDDDNQDTGRQALIRAGVRDQRFTNLGSNQLFEANAKAGHRSNLAGALHRRTGPDAQRMTGIATEALVCPGTETGGAGGRTGLTGVGSGIKVLDPTAGLETAPGGRENRTRSGTRGALGRSAGAGGAFGGASDTSGIGIEGTRGTGSGFDAGAVDEERSVWASGAEVGSAGARRAGAIAVYGTLFSFVSPLNIRKLTGTSSGTIPQEHKLIRRTGGDTTSVGKGRTG